MATPPESEPRVHTRMDMGNYTTWRCLGCPSNGNHHKAPPAQVHADLTGHNVQVTVSEIYVVFPAGQPPVPVQTKPGGGVHYAIPFSVHPDDVASEQPSPSAPAQPGIQVNVDPPRGPQIIPVNAHNHLGGPNPGSVARRMRSRG